MKIDKNLLLSLLFIITAILKIKFEHNHSLTEVWYSNSVYVYISKVLRKLFGIFPFSVGDVLYTLLLVYFGYLVFLLFKGFKQNYSFVGGKLIQVGYCFFFLFHFLWGFNYNRERLEDKLSLEVDYNLEELREFTLDLIEKANKLHSQLIEDDKKLIGVPYEQEVLFKQAYEAYQELAKENELFRLQNHSVKNSLYSTLLSYMGYSGYFNPFTGEAQVNKLNRNYSLAFTITHEMAHQLGYAAEDEANFIGYLACLKGNTYFQYSGTLFAINQCLRILKNVDNDAYQWIRAELKQGILVDYELSYSFWKQYSNPLEPLFKNIYDGFLKVNNQTNGINAYSYSIWLIMAYDRKNSNL